MITRDVKNWHPVLTFELPLPPNLNGSGWGGSHWTKEKAKKVYWDHLDLLAMGRHLPKAPVYRLRSVVATGEIRTCPIMDQDNAYRRMKWVWDWLQSRGYIVNDKLVRCDLTPVASKRKEQGITLTLEAG